MSAIKPSQSKAKARTNEKSKSTTKDKKSKAKEKGKGNTKILSNPFVYDPDLEDDSVNEEEEDGESSTLIPPGSTRLTAIIDADEFDYDTLKENEDLELCILRVPEGIKPKHLSNLNLSLPLTSPANTITTQRIGTLEKKDGSYDLWSIHPNSSGTGLSPNNDDDDVVIEDGNAIGGEELFGLSCLLPRKKEKKGKATLFLAPKPITHHLILSAKPTLPTPPPSSPDDDRTNTQNSKSGTTTNVNVYKNPTRFTYPKHLLKHRFIPTGGARTPYPSSSSPPESGTLGVEADQGMHSKEKQGMEKKEKERVKVKLKDVQVGSPLKKKRKAGSDSKQAKKAKTSTGL